MFSSTQLCVLAACTVLAQAQSIPAVAAPSALSVVDQQYTNSGLDTLSLTGFGTSLTSTALLEVVYDSFGLVSNGAAYTVDQVANQPTVYVTPSNASASTFTSSETYTLMLADAASLGDPDVEGNYRHFLANGLTGSAPSDGNLTFSPSGGNTVTYYASPGPIAGTGPHRYAWLFFSQPATFNAPSDLSGQGVAPSHWNVSSYVQQTGLTLLAASFFTVENGAPTGSVVATSAASTAAASSTAASSTGSAATTGKASSSTTSGAPAATSSKASSASSLTSRTIFSLATVGAIAVFTL